MILSLKPHHPSVTLILAYTSRILHGSANIWSLSSSAKKYFTSKRSEQVKYFFHEKVNFICSNQRVISFLLHIDMSVSKIKQKLDEKQRNDVSESSLVRIWKISRSYPGCSFVWKILVVHFSVEHSYLCNKKKITRVILSSNPYPTSVTFLLDY